MNAFRIKRKLLQRFGVLILIAILLLGAPPVHGLQDEDQETQTDVYTLKDFDYQTDQNFQGVQVDRTFNLTLPEDWSIESDATLSIRFSHSPALNPTSSMNVRWNGNLVGSTLLTKENTQNGLLEVSLPAEDIIGGFNTLQVEFYMGIAENFCIDFDNPAVWAVVHNDSNIQLTHQRQTQEPELNKAPGTLIDSSLLAENTFTLIIPSNPELEISQALARMAASLGRMAEWRNIDISVMTIDETQTSEPVGNLVVIGTLAQIDDAFPQLNRQIIPVLNELLVVQEPLYTDEGLIFFQTSPFDPESKVFILTGENLRAVEKSVLAATLDSFYEEATGAWSIIRSVPGHSDTPDSGELSLSLNDLGIDDQTAFGTREQTIQFNLPMSALWDINTEALLELHFAHSELLNSERSTLSVILNSIPVASIPLTPESANDGFEEVRIPLRYFKVGDNTFTLRANLEHRASREDYINFCNDETYPRAWITIQSDTSIVFPEMPDQTPLNLGSFPFGFADVFSYENFAFVLAPEPNITALKAMGEIAVSMGRTLKGHPAVISVLTSEQLGDADQVQYHIMIGISENLLNESMNNQLPLPLNLETGSLQPNQTVLEINTPSDFQGIIQAFKVGLEDVFLLLTGSSPKALTAGGNLLTDPEVRTTLDGNLAVFNTADQAASYQVRPSQKEPVSLEAPQSDEAQQQALTSQSVWIVRISLGLAALSVIVLVIALFTKNKNTGKS